MSIVQLAQATFRPTVESTGTLVVEFTIASGVPADIHPLSDQFPSVTFARVDPARERAVAAMFGVSAEQALLIFRDRIVLYCEAGEHSAERIAGLLTQVCALDMDRVRAAIDEEKCAEVALRMRRMCPTARRGLLAPEGPHQHGE